MSKSHPSCWTEDELLAHCKLSFSRASGPGGQNRNKVETSVQIEFLPSGTIAHASERRTQNENRKVALMRLRCRLALEQLVEPNSSSQVPVPAPTPSEAWVRYCKDGRINISDGNQEWPELLAELIETLRKTDWELAKSAELLQTSSSQLIKLLKKYPPAMVMLNQERNQRGLRSF